MASMTRKVEEKVYALPEQGDTPTPAAEVPYKGKGPVVSPQAQQAPARPLGRQGGLVGAEVQCWYTAAHGLKPR